MSSTPKGYARFQRIIRELGNAAPGFIPYATKVLQSHLESTTKAGTDAYDSPWPLTKKGAKALPNAASHIRYVQGRLSVSATIYPPYSYHHTGRGWHYAPKRRILPSRKLPPKLSRALTVAFKAYIRGKVASR